MTLERVALVAGLAAILVAIAAYVVLRARRERRDAGTLARSRSEETHLPASLHPVIDPTVCIGSLSCVKACPEGDILGIVDGAGALISGANCIGHGRCAVECPVDAIKLVFGTSERGVDLPELDEVFETSRPGVHVVGELGGMGLIKNAMTQGIQVGAHLGAVLRAEPPRPSASGAVLHDVVIVGAGAAGLAAALSAKAEGLTIAILEQDTMGGTVAHYPRQKIVMTDRVDLPLFGKFGKRRMAKEELLAAFARMVEKAKLPIVTGVKVTEVGGSDGDFTLTTDNGLTFHARKVVLAVGRRGSPRKLGAAGEELNKVTYRLVDPEQYAGARVLVAGGGDSALEAAASLAEAGAEVTIAYRGPTFVRSRVANQERVKALAAAGKLTTLFETTVREIRPHNVVLQGPGHEKVLENDYVIAALGGELPFEFLKRAGIEIKRHFGEVRAPSPHRAPGRAARAAKPRTGQDEESRRRLLARALFVVGAILVGYLAWVGRDYYPLGPLERRTSPLHAELRSSGPWGHGVGLVATLFMLSNFVYALRKRFELFKGSSPIRTWLTWHMFVGFMSPMVIAFHAAFQSKNLLATSTSVAVLVVVATGIVGRFIYGLVPAAHGKVVEHGELMGRWERARSALGWADAGAVAAVVPEHLLQPPPKGRSLLVHLALSPLEAVEWIAASRRIRAVVGGDEAAVLLASLGEARLLRTQIGFYRSLKRLLSWWRVLHVVLAVFLVVAIAIHVGVSIYLGYGLGWGAS